MKAEQYYKAYNEALNLLYDSSILNLEKENELFTFSAKVIEDCIKKLHKEKKFTPDVLTSKEGEALILENFRILEKAVDKGVQSAKLKTEIPEDLTKALKDNAFIFSGWKAFHTLKEAGISLADSNGGIKSLEKFKEEAGEVFKAQKLNLMAEYRHAVSSAQSTASWNQIMEDGDDYDLQYRTVGDDKVREEHIALQNVTLPPSDAFWLAYYPPNGWGCRCTAVQVRKGKYKSTMNSENAILAGNAATAKPNQAIFRTNAGVTQKLFPDKHPNFPKGCGDCDNKIKLAYDKDSEKCKSCINIKSVFDKKRKKESDE